MSAVTSRRQFLKTTGIAAVGTALAAQAVPRVHAAEENTIQIALIGCGGRGNGAILQALNTKSGPTKLVAMGDVFEDRVVNSRKALQEHFGEEQIDVPQDRVFHGFDCYKKAMDCLKPGDAVILATACGFRPLHVDYAIEKGLHIFMEKPFAVDSPGTRRIAAAAKKADEKNLKLACGLMWRHCKAREAVIERIHNGEIGDVLHLRGFRMHGPIWAGHTRGNVTNEIAYQVRNFHYFDWAGGNIFIDYCIHNIDVACWAKGAWPVRAMGMGGRTDFVPGTGYDTYYTEFEFADGSHLTSHGRYNAGCYNQYSDFAHGTKGSAVLMDNLGGANSRIYKNHNMTDANLAWRFSEPEPDPYQREQDLFFDAIRNDKKYNEGHRAADANFASLLSRAAINSGQIVTWEQVVNSDVELFPGGVENITWDSKPPVLPDENGNYPIVIPGKGYAI
ncbi:MAG: Gfo/Idh/MocA family oxidoreductase [Planctomycetaceae bacterium]|nr:Gfo/Idh/MocA family oxidoreductase [Planctomycetaceae bacterium]